MKSLILLFLIALSLSENVKAQKIYTIQIDFEGLRQANLNLLTNEIEQKYLKVPEGIEVGDYYRIVIRNINLNMYKISINAVDTSSEVSLSTPTFASLPIDPMAGLTKGLISSISSSDLVRTRSLKLALDDFMTSESPLIATNPISQFQVETVAPNLKPIADALNVIVERTTGIGVVYQSIFNKKDELDLNRIKIFIQGISIGNTRGDLKEIVFQDALELRNDINELSINYYDLFENYNSIIEDNSKEIAGNVELKNFSESIKNQLLFIENSIIELRKSVATSTVTDEAIVASMMDLNSEKIYVSLPFELKEKDTTIKLSITPRDQKYLQNKLEATFSFINEDPTYYGTGISFYYSTLTDERFSIIKNFTDTDTTYSIERENLRSGEIGISSALRIGKILEGNGKIGGHFVLGAGLNIDENVRPRLMLGLGITYGSSAHSLALDLGVVAGHVYRLSNSINLNNTFPEKPDRVTISELDFKRFISIGYVYRLKN